MGSPADVFELVTIISLKYSDYKKQINVKHKFYIENMCSVD